ncbi:MAG: RNA-binding protein, partial [Akkermansia sp.]|nr:RNA-binding protein [Akkermansia sp.]
TRNARLYVGNLSYEATESELEDLFKGFGNVRSVEIIYNPRTYKSKGYAFIEMFQLDDARRAAEVLHGQPFMGRELMVSAASERPENNESPDTPAENEAAEPTPAESEATEPAAEPPSEQA